MKLSKDQVKFLEICTSLKVIDIVPKAAEQGIPEAAVRKFLRKKGFEYLVEKWEKIGAEEFLILMTAANGQYQAAVEKYLAILRKVAPVSKTNPDPDLTMAKAEVESLSAQIVWLVGGLLDKSTSVYGVSARRAAKELFSKPKVRKARRG